MAVPALYRVILERYDHTPVSHIARNTVEGVSGQAKCHLGKIKRDFVVIINKLSSGLPGTGIPS
jgi:hypothetical protein